MSVLKITYGRVFFLINLVSVCLLIGEFNPFTFEVITYKRGLTSKEGLTFVIMLLFFSVLRLCFS